MQRAQISFDFILAITAALIFVGTLAFVGLEMEQMQAEAAVRKQLHLNGLNLAAVISKAGTLSDAGTATVSYTVPKILVPGESTPQGCSIEVEGSKLKLSYEVIYVEEGESKTVEVRVPFKNPAGMQLSPDLLNGEKGTCGGTIEILKS